MEFLVGGLDRSRIWTPGWGTSSRCGAAGSGSEYAVARAMETERNFTGLVAFAMSDAICHALLVDVLRAELAEFGATLRSRLGAGARGTHRGDAQGGFQRTAEAA